MLTVEARNNYVCVQDTILRICFIAKTDQGVLLIGKRYNKVCSAYILDLPNNLQFDSKCLDIFYVEEDRDSDYCIFKLKNIQYKAVVMETYNDKVISVPLIHTNT